MSIEKKDLFVNRDGIVKNNKVSLVNLLSMLLGRQRL